jgi:hypothetical protein
MFAYRRVALQLICLLAIATPCSAWSEQVRFSAELSGAEEVPPVSGNGSGKGELIFETTTNQLTYAIVYRDLTGPATAAHVHGPGQPGSNAPVVLTFMIPASPIRGTETLGSALAEALLGGQLYVNVHTQAYQSGEIRGQIKRAP